MMSVLVIENDRACMDQLCGLFSSHGIDCLVAEEGTMGLQMISDRRPDLIILSIELPTISGYSICKKLKRNPDFSNIPLFLISSTATEETFEQHRKLKTRAQEYFIKPFSYEALWTSARAHLHLPGPRSNLDNHVPDPAHVLDEGDIDELVGQLGVMVPNELFDMDPQGERADEAPGPPAELVPAVAAPSAAPPAAAPSSAAPPESTAGPEDSPTLSPRDKLDLVILKKQLQRREDDYNALRQEHSAVLNELIELRESSSSTIQQVTALRQELTRKKIDLDELHRKVSDLEIAEEHMSASLAQANAALETLDSQQSRLHALNAEHDLLEERFTDQLEEIQRFELQRREAQARFEASQIEVDNLKQSLEQALLELDSERGSVQTLGSALDVAAQEREELKLSFDEEQQGLIAQQQLLAQQIDLLKADLEAASSRGQSLESQLKQAQDEARAQTSKDAADLSALKEQLDEALMTIEMTHEQLEASQDSARALEEELKEARGALGGQVEAARAESSELKARLEEANETLSATKAEAKAAKAEAEAAKAEAEAAKTEAEAAKTEAEAAQADLDATRADLDATRADLDATRADLDAGSTDLDAANAQLDALKGAASRDATVKTALKQQLDDLNAQTRQLQLNLDDAKSRAAQALQAEGEKVDALKQQIQASGDEIANLMGQLGEAQTSLESSEGQVEAERARTAALEEELKEARGALGGQVEAARAESSELKARLEEANETLSATKAEAKAAKAEAEAAKAEAEAAKTEAEAAKTEAEAAQADLDATRADLDATRADLDATRADLDDISGRLAAGSTDLDAANAQLDALKGAASRDATVKTAIKQQLDDLNADRDRLEGELKDAKAHAEEIQRALDLKRNDSQRHKEERDSFEAEVFRISGELKALQSVHRDAVARVEELSKAEEGLGKAVEAEKASAEAAERKLAQSKASNNAQRAALETTLSDLNDAHSKAIFNLNAAVNYTDALENRLKRAAEAFEKLADLMTASRETLGATRSVTALPSRPNYTDIPEISLPNEVVHEADDIDFDIDDFDPLPDESEVADEPLSLSGSKGLADALIEELTNGMDAGEAVLLDIDLRPPDAITQDIAQSSLEELQEVSKSSDALAPAPPLTPEPVASSPSIAQVESDLEALAVEEIDIDSVDNLDEVFAMVEIDDNPMVDEERELLGSLDGSDILVGEIIEDDLVIEDEEEFV